MTVQEKDVYKRQIFRMACQGIGTTTIAEILTAEQVLIPYAYTATVSYTHLKMKREEGE